MTHLFDPPTPNFPEHHDPHHVDPHHADHQQTIESGNSQIDANSVNPVDSQSVLRNPNFLSLWSGQVFSQIADKIFLVLVIAIVSTQFQHEGETISGWVSAVMVAFCVTLGRTDWLLGIIMYYVFSLYFYAVFHTCGTVGNYARRREAKAIICKFALHNDDYGSVNFRLCSW